jgi:hypothetical protein
MAASKLKSLEGRLLTVIVDQSVDSHRSERSPGFLLVPSTPLTTNFGPRQARLALAKGALFLLRFEMVDGFIVNHVSFGPS